MLPNDGVSISGDEPEYAPRTCSTLPWAGDLHHARGLCDDWGCIRDENDDMVLTVVLPTHDDAVLNEHRRNKTDPTQPVVDAILAIINKANNDYSN